MYTKTFFSTPRTRQLVITFLGSGGMHVVNIEKVQVSHLWGTEALSSPGDCLAGVGLVGVQGPLADVRPMRALYGSMHRAQRIISLTDASSASERG